MDARRILCVLVASLGLVGCRSGTDPSIDLLESELRWMEDQLYLLDDQLEQKCAQVASCHRENQALRYELMTAQQGGTDDADHGSSRLDQLVPRPRGTLEPEFDESELAPPAIEMGDPVNPTAGPVSTPSATLPLAVSLPASSTLGRTVDRGRPVESLITASDGTSEIDAHITRIELNSRLTGGYDFDGKPGHEGLLIVIEPRNMAGNYVPIPGPVSIAVIDPVETGPAARVARWDFTSSEAASHMRRSLLGKGIHLELPWPHEPPRHDRLEVYARYYAPDGRKLQADRIIHVSPIVQIPPSEIVWNGPSPVSVSPPSVVEFEPLDGTTTQQLLTAPVLTPTTTDRLGTDQPRARRATRGLSELPRLPQRTSQPTIPGWRPYR